MWPDVKVIVCLSPVAKVVVGGTAVTCGKGVTVATAGGDLTDEGLNVDEAIETVFDTTIGVGNGAAVVSLAEAYLVYKYSTVQYSILCK